MVVLPSEHELTSAPPCPERPGVYSEVGTLRRVIVHRPGAELARVTPGNKEALLFDDVPWLERAQEEHDAFTATLRRYGVEVLTVRSLLLDVLREPAARGEILAGACDERALGAGLAESLQAHLEGMPSEDLLEALLCGVQFGQLGRGSRSLPAAVADPRDFVLDPLPNHLFARDSSAWVGAAAHLGQMAHGSRVRESQHLQAIYRHHPLFARSEAERTWADGDRFEGGDLLVVNSRRLAVGVSSRTNTAAIERLAESAFQRGFEEMLAVEVPVGRSFIHLDTVMSMVDWDSFTVFRPVLDSARVWRLRPGIGGLRVCQEASVVGALSRAVGGGIRVLPADGDEFTRHREQWGEAHNVLAIRPGLVVAYDRNAAANRALSDAGVEVVEVPGSELSRGRGGPRCLTCPVLRSAS